MTFLDNHDQVANSGRGRRLHQVTSPGRYRAITALLLLGPSTPMLFQGQEFAASSPFQYFADHQGELREAVREGRFQFLAQFPGLAAPEMRPQHPDPADLATFEMCKLNFTERTAHAEVYRMHKDLLRMRRRDAAFRAQRPGGIDGAVLGDEALLLRYFEEGGDDRLLLLNLGADLRLDPAPQPLLAPPEGRVWRVEWSSEDPVYGGGGTGNVEGGGEWRIPAHAAIVMRPVEPAEEWLT